MRNNVNNDVITLMDEFLTPVRQEKAAADSIEAVKNSAAPVVPEVKKGDGTNQGAFGTGKQKDIKDGANGAIPADSLAAQVQQGASKKPTDDQGTKSLDSSQQLNQPSVTVNRSDDPSKDNVMNDKEAKIRRNVYLAENIKALMSVEKEAADQDEALFIAAYERGLEKRAEDEQELVDAGMDPKEATAVLDTVAQANPTAVLPEEAQAAPAPDDASAPAPDDASASAPDDASVPDDATVDDLAKSLDDAGVSVDDLTQAADMVQQLGQAGVSPEEVVSAVQNASGDAPLPQDKTASNRIQIIQEHLGLLRNNR